MTSIAYRKVKSVAKDIVTQGETLDSIISNTMQTISAIVGSTLGPGGSPVLIERQETGFPNLVTKDGVTVFRNLGFNNPTQHAIMETARDASVRTATEAGDGTTTATVLSEALVRLTHEYLRKHPRSSPQKVVRRIESVFRKSFEPWLKAAGQSLKITADVQHAICMCSTNGDAELTDAVLECFKLTGDEGNVTIVEDAGPSGYRVEQLKGYSLGIGFEESCRAFFPEFVNDSIQNRSLVLAPKFILYYGALGEIQQLLPLLQSATSACNADPTQSRNFVLMATGFGDSLLADLAANFKSGQSLKIFPLLIPKSIVHNAEMHVLQDIAALTSGQIFDPLTNPVENATYENIGTSLEYFEALRYRSNVVGRSDPDLLMARIDEVRQQAANPESSYEKVWIEERLAKLTGGIAKLIVSGASSGEIREKRDRAEDATCALRGAFKHGCIPGAGWGLVACHILAGAAESKNKDEADVMTEVLQPALLQPLQRLMSNAGLNAEETATRIQQAFDGFNSEVDLTKVNVWDGMTDSFRPAIEAGIVDSLPAVVEAIRNSISIATLLGTLGGTVVFKRDVEVERQDASDAYHWLSNSIQPK